MNGTAAWIQRWWRKLTLFSGLEITARVLQMIAALLVVRNMEKDQYAWYSLANGFQGMLGFITMIGAGAAIYAIGGSLVGNPSAMGSLINAVKRWRGFMLAVSIPVVLPLFAFLLYRNDCPPLLIGLLFLLAVVILFLEIQRHLLAAPLELAMEFNLLQKVEVLCGVVRVVALLVLVLLAWMNPFSVFLVAALLVSWLPVVILPRFTARHADPDAPPASPETVRRIRGLSFAALPGSVSYMVEAQFAGIFIALSGHTEGVADLGAITRIGLLVAVPAAIIERIITPKLARLSVDGDLARAWRRALLFGAAVGIGLILGVAVFRQWILLLLGPAYAGLEYELVLFAVFQGLSFFTRANASIIEARGWLKRSWLRPLIVIGAMVLAAFFLPITTVSGAIGLMITGCLGNLVVDLILLTLGFRGRSNV
jgi:O-antigen/teichoic acid export membrane protein